MKLRPMLVLVAVLASWSHVGDAQTLKIATLAPEGSFWMVEMRAGAKEIEERSDGRVKFRFYGGGVQGKDSKVVRKMRAGQLQGATFTSGSLGQFTSSAEIYALPFTFLNMDEVLYVRERMDDTIRQSLEDSGMANFGLSGAGVSYLMSNTPVTTLADMSGQKTWVQEGDEVAYAAFKALGISPVPLPLTDVLTGLQTELLDSVSVSPVGAVVLQLHTKLKYISDLQLSYVYGALIIDKKPFSRLTPADQSVVREVMERIYRKFDVASITDNTEALQALRDSGLQLIEPDTADIHVWREKVAESNRALAKQGSVDLELMDEMLAHLADYRANKSP